MRSIIIEDQAPAQRILQKYINSTANLKLEMTFCDALEAKTYLQHHPVDLVFLDIDLPRLSGIDFLRSEQSAPLTILTTAYSEYALESYQYNVIDYLLKPYSFERFIQAIDKVVTLTSSAKQHGNQNQALYEKYVYVKSNHELIKILKDDIIFIKSDSDYTELVTATNTYLSSEALKDWITKLDNHFTQIHKSYIINTNHLKKVSHNKVYLSAGNVAPIGRAFKKGFVQTMANAL